MGVAVESAMRSRDGLVRRRLALPDGPVTLEDLGGSGGRVVEVESGCHAEGVGAVVHSTVVIEAEHLVVNVVLVAVFIDRGIGRTRLPIRGNGRRGECHLDVGRVVGGGLRGRQRVRGGVGVVRLPLLLERRVDSGRRVASEGPCRVEETGRRLVMLLEIKEVSCGSKTMRRGWQRT